MVANVAKHQVCLAWYCESANETNSQKSNTYWNVISPRFPARANAAALSTSALAAVGAVAPFWVSFLGLTALAHVLSATAFSCASTIKVVTFFLRHDWLIWLLGLLFGSEMDYMTSSSSRQFAICYLFSAVSSCHLFFSLFVTSRVTWSFCFSASFAIFLINKIENTWHLQQRVSKFFSWQSHDDGAMSHASQPTFGGGILWDPLAFVQSFSVLKFTC